MRATGSQEWTYLFAVFVGGGLGSLLRYAVSRAGEAMLGPQFPAWTIFVNVTGSLAMGLIAGWLVSRGGEHGQALRLFMMTGILGGYTTFSAFSLDVALLWERHSFMGATVYVLSSVALSLVGIFAGLAAARALMS